MRVSAFAMIGLLAAPLVVQAQGTGSTGAQVLQLIAGGRASALSGAYTAVAGDAEALFYNPAGVATLQRGAALAYERYVEEIALASFAGVFRIGGASFGLSGLFLDGGDVIEIVPDPVFGGNTGRSTGKLISASEGIARLSFAMPFGERVRLGASAGFLSSSIADESRGAPVFDLGAQYDLSFATFGAALRNVGGSLSGGSFDDADLPTEARIGGAVDLTRPNGLGVQLTADLIARLRESSAGFLIGAEAGYHTSAERSLGVVARVGFSGAEGDGGLSALRFGAGLTLTTLSVDYTYQSLDFFGSVHRFGLRWTVPR